MIGIVDSNQKIITNGLVLNLDAAQLRSYSGSGTIWNDISGNGNNGTLTNGPTFSNTGGGSIVFDRVDDYVITGNTTLNVSTNANFTYSAWIYPNFSSSLNTGRAILNSTGAAPTYLRAYLRWEGASFGFYFDIADSGGGSAWRTNPIPTFSANTWHYLCFTHDSSNTGTFYFDGAALATTLIVNNPRTVANNPITLGYGSVNSYYWGGNIGLSLIYNRTLTSLEVLQNYNGTKSRFGL